jgi:prophage maintenance system killer protein
VSQEPWAQLISADGILDLHAESIRRYGGDPTPTPLPGCVERSLGAAWNAELYAASEQAIQGCCFAGCLLYYLIMNHCFIDGNKRVGWVACMEILRGLGLTVNATDDEVEGPLCQYYRWVDCQRGRGPPVVSPPANRPSGLKRRQESPMPSEEAFTQRTWKAKLSGRLQDWRARMQQYGAPSVYAFLSAATLWPVVEAARDGEWTALTALGGVSASLGSNLLAERIGRWKDEADGVRRLADEVSREPALRAELDAVLETLQVFSQARQALPEAEHSWFDAALRSELRQLGSPFCYEAHVSGSGAVAQGPGAVAGGAGSVIVTGRVQQGVINTGHVTGNIVHRVANAPSEIEPKE